MIRKGGKRRGQWSVVAISLVAMGGVAVLLLPLAMADVLISNAKIDFKQVANNDSGSTEAGCGSPACTFEIGDTHWINSIVQSSNSRYFEGMSTPQRLIITDIPATVDNPSTPVNEQNKHELDFNHQANKGGIHAYDFLTSWEQAQTAANDICPPDGSTCGPIGAPGGLMNTLFFDASTTGIGACGEEISIVSPTNTQNSIDACEDLRTAALSGYQCKVVNIPDGMTALTHGSPAHTHSIQQRICEYELLYGERTLKICANAAFLSPDPVLTWEGYTGSTDMDANWQLEWHSAATSVYIEVAGHISIGTGSAGNLVCGTQPGGIGYGSGQGASAISGGPYHFRLRQLDGGSIGQQDNQIKGADIHVDCCPPNATQPGGVCDDGVACTIDACDNSVLACPNGPEACSHTPNHDACNDNNPCTDDVCNTVSGCQHTPDNSNNCKDPFYCNGNEQCFNGVCQPGTPPCNDGVFCTIDTCNEVTDICTFTPDDSACPSDGNPCSDEVCNPMSGCGSVCDNTNSCDNGLYCDGMESCSNCVCTDGPDPCPADACGCTTELCDEAADVCVQLLNHGFCQNAFFCDGSEICDPVQCCIDGPNPCSFPTVCHEPKDDCQSCLNDSHCQDGLYCNGAEFCDTSGPTGICMDGPDPCVGDGLDCTIDSCNEGAILTDNAGTCVSTPLSSFCDDSNGCTNDLCDGNATPPGTGCVYSCNTTMCDDFDACTINDVCSGSTPPCTCSGTPTDCSYLNDQCNVGACDASTGNCIAVPANEGQTCNDGVFCTCGDRCVAGVCTPTTSGAACCNDGIACTNDSCDEILAVCINFPNDTKCDDALYCNGFETCNVPARACVDGPDPCPEDMFFCTTITCVESGDSCLCTPDNIRCDDFDPCTTDTCVCGTGCAHTPSGLCGACCDGDTGLCEDDVLCTDCEAIGGQHVCHPLYTCAEVIASGDCVRHTGACCDGTTGTCTDGTYPEDCTGPPEAQLTWHKSELCAMLNPPCMEHTGACCDRRIADPVLRCRDDIPASLCVIDDPTQVSWYKDTACADVDDGCEEHTGACCDMSPLAGGPGPEGVCTDNIVPRNCNGPQQTWYKFTPCSQVTCLERTGACCNTLDGTCTGNVAAGDCEGAQRLWTKGATCADVEPCPIRFGACCDGDTFGACTQTVSADCDCPKCAWYKLAACEDISCTHNVIPTVSQWGLLVLTLLLLTGAKVYFGRRPETNVG